MIVCVMMRFCGSEGCQTAEEGVHMWLLPFEKLPGWISGPVLLLIGVVQAIYAVPLSLDQAGAFLFIVLGGFIAVMGYQELERDMDAFDSVGPRAVPDRIQAMKAAPDFSKYSKDELRNILRHINREKYPERAREVEQRLAGMRPAEL